MSVYVTEHSPFLRLQVLPLNLPVVLVLVNVIPPVGTAPVTVAVQVVDEPMVTGPEQVTFTVAAVR